MVTIVSLSAALTLLLLDILIGVQDDVSLVDSTGVMSNIGLNLVDN